MGNSNQVILSQTATNGDQKSTCSQMLKFQLNSHKTIPGQNDFLKHISSIQFSPDSKRIASVYGNGLLVIWNVESADYEDVLQYKSKIGLNDVIWTDDEKLVSVSEDGNVQLWDPRDSSRKLVTTYEGHRCKALCCAANSKKLIASGSHDGNVRLWDIRTSNSLKDECLHDGPVTAVDFNKEGNLLTSGYDGFIYLWNDTALKYKTTYTPLGVSGDRRIYSARFSPNGKYILASEAITNTIELWSDPNNNAPKLIKTYKGHQNHEYRLRAHFLDNTHIVSGSKDSRICTWNLQTEVNTGIITVEGPAVIVATDVSPSQSLIAYVGLGATEPGIRIVKATQEL